MSPSLSIRKLSIIGLISLALIIFVYFETQQPTTTSEVKTNNVDFNFDNGDPSLNVKQNTPFHLTVKGIDASFTSPSDPGAFSIQNVEQTSLKLSQFSGNFLETTNQSRVILDIKFSVKMVAINITFSTAEIKNEDLTEPSVISLLAYDDTILVGTAEAYGTFSSDSYPQGKLSLGTSKKPFNWVRILMPAETSTTSFLIDNINVIYIPIQ